MNRRLIVLGATATLAIAGSCLAQSLASDAVLASDIPVAHTPRGFWKTFPQPVLAQCTEPLAPGAPDLRGLWAGEHDGKNHVERIEQCGNRVVIESSRVTHDMRADGILAHGVDDIAQGSGLRIKVAAVFKQNGLVLKPFGGPALVSRVLKGDTLVFNYSGKVILLHRIAALPPGA